MNESVRTLTFVGVAVASIAVAWIVHASSQPAEPEDFGKVGAEFYPDFSDPTAARSLEIADYDDKDSAKVHKFTVEFKNGRWRIPSHHGYPADAKDRLEKAAASLIGITRKSLAGRGANSHERFGVVDPLGKNASKGDGLGQRIIIKDKNGNVLADYILGKRVAGQDHLYFVRKPGEDETYRAEIELDVSTKFADWVEQDLLKLDRNNLLSMEFKTTKFEEREAPLGLGLVQFPTGKDSIKVYRGETGPGAKWKLDNLDPKTEEINTAGVSSIQTALDGLELKGVRPKPQGLTPQLTVDLAKFPKDQHPQQYFNNIDEELVKRGFMLANSADEDPKEPRFLLYGQAGEMVAQSSEGLIYHLYFGKSFTGTEAEIEVGKTEIADEEGKAVSEKPAKDKAEKSESTRNRYLFIRVGFDQSLIGNPPTKPEEPAKPEGLKDEKEPGAKAADDSDEKSKDAKADEEQQKMKAEYQTKLAIYKADLSRYEKDKQDYDKKVKDGKAKESELNNRFEDWYYVVTDSSYDNLVFTRADVVKEKAKDNKTTPEAPPFGNLPGAGGNPVLPGPPISQEPKPAVADKPATPAEAAKPETAPEPK